MMAFLLLYEILPVILLFAVVVLAVRLGCRHEILLACCVLLSLVAHLRYGTEHPVAFTGDSPEYVEWARSWKSNPMAIRRAPLYPLFLQTFTSSRAGLKDPTLLQHLLMAGLVPLVWLLALRCGQSKTAALFAALLVAIDPLLVQSSQEIMTESLSTAFVVLCILGLIAFIRKPNFGRAIALGTTFSLASHVRGVTDPLFALIVAALLIWNLGRRRFRDLKALGVCVLAFIILNAPFSLYNLRHHSIYGRSQMQGLTLMTKAVSYSLLESGAPKQVALQASYREAMIRRGFGLDYRSPDLLADWDLNAIPHDMMYTLVPNRMMTYAEADRAMSQWAFRSLLGSPLRYACAIGEDLGRLLFVCREYYPDPRILLGLDNAPMPRGGPALGLLRFARGMVHPTSWFLVLAALAFILRPKAGGHSGLALPAGVFCYGYLITAAVEIGLTRYTIPWLPFRAILIAAGIEYAALRIWARRPGLISRGFLVEAFVPQR